MLYQLEGFDEQFRQIVHDASLNSGDKSSAQLKLLEADEAQLAREKLHLLASIKQFGPKPILLDEVEAIEGRERDLVRRRFLIEKSAKQPLRLPQSVAELRAGPHASTSFTTFPNTSVSRKSRPS